MRKDRGDLLKILYYDRNQVDHKIAWGLGGEFPSVNSSFVNLNNPF